MVQLTDRQIAGYAAFIHPGDREKTAVMTAIAIAESGGRTDEHNFNPATRDDSYGLWQINMYAGLGPERRRDLGLSSNTELLNPETNMRAADYVYERQGFAAWGAYTNGSYRQYMDRARAVSNITGESSDKSVAERAGDFVSDPLEALTQPLQAISSLVDPILKGFEWLGDPANWIRIVQVGGGITLALVAGAIVVTNSKTTQTIVKAVK